MDAVTNEARMKWTMEHEAVIFRVKSAAHNAVFVCGPYTRDLDEAFLRVHALIKDNGPIISRLFFAD